MSPQAPFPQTGETPGSARLTSTLSRVLLGAALFLGCTAQTQEEVKRDRTKVQRVLEGTPSNEESVVLVLSERPDGASLCTGTLIAPRLVLTARHCVSTYVEGEYTCTIEGSLDLSRPRTPANAGEIGAVMRGPQVSVHAGGEPDFETPTSIGEMVLAPETDSICRNDIALVVLADALDLPLSKVRLGEGLDYRETVTVIGYGLNEQQLNHRRQRSGVSVLGVGPSEFFEPEGQAMPRTFVVESSVCPGDSGGPALSDETGEILGVFSLFRGQCHSKEARNFFTQVAPFEKLLRAGFDYLGQEFPEKELDPKDDSPGQAGSPGSFPEPPEDQGSSGGCQLAGPSACPTSPTLFATMLLWAGAGLLLVRRRVH